MSEKMISNLVSNEWGKKFFNNLYWKLFMKREPHQIISDATMIESLGNLKAGDSVLDVCCGVADVANYLANSVKTVKGIEWSDDYAQIARTLSPKVHLLHDNALTIELKERFDVVYNWYSSFAYFDNVNNQKLLSNCNEWLKPDGVFLLESYNAYHVIRNFREDTHYENFDDNRLYRIHRKSEIDWKLRRLNQFWTITDEDNLVQTYDTFTILYMMDEMINFLSPYFKDIEVWGRNKAGELEEFSIDSPRYIIRAKKKS